jgi:hypothetical protein
LVPFFAFASTYDASKAHNMLALMLDQQFKSFNVVKAFVEWAKVMQMVIEYDNKILLPFLMIAFQFFNHMR